MKSKLLDQSDGGRTFAIVFSKSDEVIQGMQSFANEHALHAASFAAIGAFEDLVIGWFDWETKDYKRIPVKEQVEVLSLLGDITTQSGVRKVHAHVVVGTSEGIARGGHLLDAHVRPTLEVFLRETKTPLHRMFDPQARIPLISIS